VGDQQGEHDSKQDPAGREGDHLTAPVEQPVDLSG
jgi:hypothetical protein